ncbi:tail fiber domain-containing protein [Sphingomonas montana]|uniref:tail fiber domain-containing protein n=1 Tax=Sphingomonas montana TaxID=1843236 RepID=UPI00096C8C6F|nr:tail fiber domain-containing protein [Sphingomonas montana]
MAIWYATGTVSVASGSPAVNGADTAFVGNVFAGDAFIGPDGRTYEIAGVSADTLLTLSRPYGGVGAAGQPYQIQPTIGPTVDASRQVIALIQRYSLIAENAELGRFRDGGVTVPAITFGADQDTGFYRTTANGIGVTLGGRLAAQFYSAFAIYTDPATAYTVDLIGRGDNTSQVRFINNGNSAVLSTLGYEPTYGLQLICALGGLRLAAPAGASVLVRVGSSDITQTTGSAFVPVADNAVALGGPGSRWSQVYVASGAISTSDERDKDWRGALTDDELAAAREIAREIGVYRWHASIAAKGDDARLHVGVRAQQVAAILARHGLDPDCYGLLCYDAWEAVAGTADVAAVPSVAEARDASGAVTAQAQPGSPAIAGTAPRAPGERYGVRYDELAMFIAAAQEQRLSALEAAA